MNRVNVEDFSGTNNGWDVEITLSGRSRANTSSFVSKTNVKRIAVYIAVNGDRLNPHLLACPNYSTSDLTPIGDENFFEFSSARHQSSNMSTSNNCRSMESTFLHER